ncbi:golgin subfamily A member 4-like [Dunckerocampus dactyliophorus]|uniref:golgin subfamily A member 4-like n=1 Tax=Dunckerocampus dactyliophorus TaxID=161453 RepID=UPI002406F92A|nr:golgin subfamily A member 4-like [Dunckerocampus dactyliophorus]
MSKARGRGSATSGGSSSSGRSTPDSVIYTEDVDLEQIPETTGGAHLVPQPPPRPNKDDTVNQMTHLSGNIDKATATALQKVKHRAKKQERSSMEKSEYTMAKTMEDYGKQMQQLVENSNSMQKLTYSLLVTTNAIQREMQGMKEQVQREAFQNEMGILRKEMQGLRVENKKLQESYDALGATLKNECEEKDKIIEKLKNTIDDMDQNTRMNDVVVTGLRIKPRSYARAVANTEEPDEMDVASTEQQVVDGVQTAKSSSKQMEDQRPEFLLSKTSRT